MRFSVVGPTYPFRGGISHYTSLLVRNLRLQHEVQFFSYSRQYPSWLFPGASDREPNSGLAVHESTTLTFDALSFRQWRRIAQEVGKSHSRLVVLPWSVVYWAPFYWVFLKNLKKYFSTKVLFVCHNVIEHESSWLKLTVSKKVITKGDYFITHSSYDKSNLVRWIGPSRDSHVRVCPHPIYEHLRSDSQLSKAEARHQVGINAERVILFFGFIREYKGLRYLLESLPRILESLQVHLLIAGEVWGKSRTYTDLIQNLKLQTHVTFVQHYIPNEEVFRYFAAADVVVVPYVTATQSGIVQLAFGFGKPVIVGNVGGLPEAVDEGKTGYLVPPRDSEAIARSVVDFYTSRREDEMVRQIEQKRSDCSWAKLSETITEIGRGLS